MTLVSHAELLAELRRMANERGTYKTAAAVGISYRFLLRVLSGERKIPAKEVKE